MSPSVRVSESQSLRESECQCESVTCVCSSLIDEDDQLQNVDYVLWVRIIMANEAISGLEASITVRT